MLQFSPDLSAIKNMKLKLSPELIQRIAARRFWTRVFIFAGLLILGITPWAQAQLATPNEPALCPPLTSIATPTLFDALFNTTPIRWPYQ